MCARVSLFDDDDDSVVAVSGFSAETLDVCLLLFVFFPPLSAERLRWRGLFIYIYINFSIGRSPQPAAALVSPKLQIVSVDSACAMDRS